MGLIANRLALTHLVTTLRNEASTGEDGWAGDPDWHVSLTDQPCYGWTDTDNNAGDERATNASVIVREDRRMIVPLGTDITETDQVLDVTYRGATILEGPMGVQAVLAYPDHLEICLRRIR